MLNWQKKNNVNFHILKQGQGPVLSQKTPKSLGYIWSCPMTNLNANPESFSEWTNKVAWTLRQYFSWQQRVHASKETTRNIREHTDRIISVHRTASWSSISLSLYWFLSMRTRAISTLVNLFLWAVGMSLYNDKRRANHPKVYALVLTSYWNQIFSF